MRVIPEILLLLIININWFFDMGALFSIFSTFIFLFFAPGFFLLNVLFENQFSYPDYLKIPIGFGLSVVLVGGTLVIISITGVTHQSLTLLLWIVNILGFLSISIKLISHPEISTPTGELLLDRIERNKNFSVIIMIAVSLVIISFSSFWEQTLNTSPQFTEFYFLGEDGQAADYLTETEINLPIVIHLGIVNHEGEDRLFSVFALTEAGVVGYLESIQVSDGMRWEDDLVLILDQVGEDQKVNILLSCEGCDFPHRELTFWVDVIIAEDEDPN